MEVKPIKVSYVSEANSEMLIKFDIEALIKTTIDIVQFLECRGLGF